METPPQQKASVSYFKENNSKILFMLFEMIACYYWIQTIVIIAKISLNITELIIFIKQHFSLLLEPAPYRGGGV